MQPRDAVHVRALRALAGAGCVALAALLIGCGGSDDGGAAQQNGGSDSGSETPQAGGTLRMGILQDALGFDPYSRALQQYTFTKVIYEPLIEYDSKMQPLPKLATEWTFNEEQTGVTVELRTGVTFHSGEPFDADAVVANFERAKDETAGQHMLFFTSVIKSAAATDADTVELKLTGPTPEPLVLDALQSLPIVDPSFFDKLENDASGTGPYKLDNWQPGQAINLVANREWWGGEGRPHLDGIEMTIFADRAAAQAAFESGSVEMLQDVDPNQAETLTSSGNEIVQGAPGALVMELRLSPQKAPLDNAAYRQALNHAIDRLAMVDAVRGGYGSPQITPWFTHSPPRAQELVDRFPYDVQKVREVIDAEGISDPSFTIMLQPSVPDTVEAAQILQAALKEIDVEVELEQLEDAAYIDKLVAGDFESTIGYGSGGQHYPSQVTFGSAWRTADNALWKNDLPQEYLDVIERLQGALDESEQDAATAELENVAIDMASVLVISDRPTLYARTPDVHGFEVTVDSMPVFDSTWLSG